MTKNEMQEKIAWQNFRRELKNTDYSVKNAEKILNSKDEKMTLVWCVGDVEYVKYEDAVNAVLEDNPQVLDDEQPDFLDSHIEEIEK